MSASAAQLNETAQRLAPTNVLCQRIDRLLSRLQPWEQLLLRSDQTADGTPKPVASMIESLRSGLGQDMARLSATMREIAQRVDGLGLPSADSPERVQKPPMIVTRSEAAEPASEPATPPLAQRPATK